ncbi:protein cdv3 [Holotrichia oblita]|uniref:Protein cdv3 n=1 Tax=Holotrichia oblita TaxID=644536 RepID=A0ACB9TLM3_HOLOL|nr:protein cdv3 [Holotrichia oblita]
MADLDDFFAKKDKKKSKSKKFSTTEEVAKKLEEPKKIEKPTKKDRVPEGEEGGDSVQQLQQVQHPRNRGKTAPDIHNEEYFPTLSGSKSGQRNRSEGSFEVVSHNKSSSHRYAEQSKLASSQGPKLALGNRFNTLSNDS